LPFYETDPNVKEIALDECGRGPMFGRVYAAAVILPRDSAMFDYSLMKDSKKIHSKKKMKTLAEYIKNHATAYSVQYAESDVIDRVNILQADMQCMHACIRDITERFPGSHSLLIDGNYFKPYGVYDENSEQLKYLPHTTIEKGDGKDEAILKELQVLIKQSKKIRFEGNGYGEEWVREAEKRGLSNFKDTPRALQVWHDKKVAQLFEEMGVLLPRELEARREIEFENYVLKIQIESRLMGDIIQNYFIPAAIEYQNKLWSKIKLNS
jgi:hypothetical protein